jgi:hypothetical protein
MPKKSLTQLAVDAIKPPAGKPREEYFDSNQPGFGLRVTERGSKSWIVLYRRRGEAKIERYTIGSLEDFPKVADARDIARQIRQRAAKGEDPKVDQQAVRAASAAAAALTVDVLIDEYLKRWARTTLTSGRGPCALPRRRSLRNRFLKWRSAPPVLLSWIRTTSAWRLI